MPNHEPKANFLNMNLLNPLANIPNQNLLAKQITVTENTYKKKMRYQQARKRNFLKGTSKLGRESQVTENFAQQLRNNNKTRDLYVKKMWYKR